jgi:phosphohistidine phosphatase
MRRLILMRHAKSSWADPGQRDLDRPLNKRGRRASALIGGWLRKKGFRPDQALVSSARRTQETWAGVVAEAGPAETRYLPELYHAGPESMLEIVQRAPDVPCLLVLGHQPGIGAFAARLLADPPESGDFDKFPTGATAVVDLDIPGWDALAWATGRLVDFAAPRTLE